MENKKGVMSKFRRYMSMSRPPRDREDVTKTCEEADPAQRSQMAPPQTVPAASPSLSTPTTPMLFTGGKDDSKGIDRLLTQYVWYHGLMPRSECEDLLRFEGDFVVRKTTMSKGNLVYVFSVLHNKEVRHIPVAYVNGIWTIRGIKRTELKTLVGHLIKDKVVLPPSGAILQTAVARPDYYILHDNITLKEQLGSGAFGEVFVGVLTVRRESAKGAKKDEPPADSKQPKSEFTEIKVAVKRLKGSIDKKQLCEFVQEAKTMRKFDHPNIVRLHGIAPQEEPIMIVLELAEGGALKTYCNKHPDITADRMTTFCKDAARGMCYLASHKVIHRDLAARNCLLGPNLEVKISDFGLSVANQTEIRLEKLKSMPVRWLAPETLTKGVFSQKTDVWSFGVLMWEIFNKCRTDPFPGETNLQARAKIVSGKDPMDPPLDMPENHAQTMRACFKQVPETRPDFVDLLKMLSPTEEPPKAQNESLSLAPK